MGRGGGEGWCVWGVCVWGGEVCGPWKAGWVRRLRRERPDGGSAAGPDPARGLARPPTCSCVSPNELVLPASWISSVRSVSCVPGALCSTARLPGMMRRCGERPAPSLSSASRAPIPASMRRPTHRYFRDGVGYGQQHAHLRQQWVNGGPLGCGRLLGAGCAGQRLTHQSRLEARELRYHGSTQRSAVAGMSPMRARACGSRAAPGEARSSCDRAICAMRLRRPCLC